MGPVDNFPTVQQLRALQIVAEAGGFANAAAVALEGDGPGLGSRSNIWQLIRRLEESVNGDAPPSRRVLLVEPGGRTVTDAGHRLLEAAQPLLLASDHLRGTLRDLGADPYVIRVSCFPSHMPLVAAVIDELKQVYTDRHVAVIGVDDVLRESRGEELMRRLASGALDAVIAPRRQTEGLHPRVIAEDLYAWRLRAVVPADHDFYGRGSVQLADVKGCALLASPRGHESRDLFEIACGESIDCRFETASVDALFALAVEARWGVALIPDDALPLRRVGRRNMPWPEIVAADGGHVGGTHAVFVRERAADDVAFIAEFVDRLREQARDQSLVPTVIP